MIDNCLFLKAISFASCAEINSLNQLFESLHERALFVYDPTVSIAVSLTHPEVK